MSTRLEDVFEFVETLGANDANPGEVVDSASLKDTGSQRIGRGAQNPDLLFCLEGLENHWYLQ